MATSLTVEQDLALDEPAGSPRFQRALPDFDAALLDGLIDDSCQRLLKARR